MITYNSAGHLCLSYDKQIIILEKWNINPLGFDELDDYINGNSELKISFFDSKSAFNSQVKINPDDFLEITMILPNTFKVYCLVKGGWLPLNLGLKHSKVIADRNFISGLINNFHQGKFKKEDELGWLSELQNLDWTIDITLFAMEANEKKFVDYLTVREQLEEAKLKIRKALPNLKLQEYKGITLHDYAWKLINDLRELIQKRQNFLLEANALMQKPFKNNNQIIETWYKLKEICEKNEIYQKDIALILSVLHVVSSDNNRSSIFNKVLKFSSGFNKETAYNASFDINLLEMFINYSVIYNDSNFIAVTSDKNLALVAAMWGNFRHIYSNGSETQFKVTIPIEFFKNDEFLQLKFKELFG
ncbi:hypothetical protein F4V57_01765 [Acinetobacter qingfengensis]|uniref:Uncharacterized protein n=1 Tax=Acinetobacter qingfengensis TaxID=1262585 RepID=A0A1E7R968_9GAMM|nr:hypothetical protein [Acinetobacter qingfengensis]KAA8735546.1 hypothetical protein F4V57_01765 [Acinetobacter qingfengensis]OEY95807.1 hypothetical protein BJI46_02475 [Acinetobacter qingfengensis]